MPSPGNPEPPASPPFNVYTLFNSDPPPAGTAFATASHPATPHTSFFDYTQDRALYSAHFPLNSRNLHISQNPNHYGSRLMPMLNPRSPSSYETPRIQSAGPVLPVPQSSNSVRVSKTPRGRNLVGDRLVYDIDVRLPGEDQPQLEVQPITKYISDPALVLGRQIAVNNSFICYGLRMCTIRVIHIRTAARALLKGFSQKVADLVFFAEDVHLLASSSVDGQVRVWEISEYQDEANMTQVAARAVIAIQITGEEQSVHPRVCWHCHKQKFLVVGIGRLVFKINTTKVRKGEKFSAGEPIICPVEKLIGGVQFVGSHDGEVTDLSMCKWMMTTCLVSASMDGTCSVIIKTMTWDFVKGTDGQFMMICYIKIMNQIWKTDTSKSKLAIDSTENTWKVARSGFGLQIKIWEDERSQPIAILRPHDGNPVNFASFFTAAHPPNHMILITGGPLNREVKIWLFASEEGRMLPSDAKLWHCIQSLEFESSQSHVEDAFFNHVTTLPQASLVLIANAKRNAIYAVHLEYGPTPEATRMDYIAEFTVTMPILSFTATMNKLLSNGRQSVQVYCVQTHAIQEYALELLHCLPSKLANDMHEKLEFRASIDAANSKKNADMVLSSGKQVEILASDFKSKASIQESGLSTHRYPVSDASGESMKPGTFTSCTSLPLSDVGSKSYISAPPPPLHLSPRLSQTRSSLKSPCGSWDCGFPISDPTSGQNVVDHSADRQRGAIHRDVSDGALLDYDSKNSGNELSQGDSMLQNPTHMATPAEILMANLASNASHGNDPKSAVELKMHSMLLSDDAENVDVEEKAVDKTGFNCKGGVGPQNRYMNSASESKEKPFFSRPSDRGLNVAQECRQFSCETSVVGGDIEHFHNTDETEAISRQSTAGAAPQLSQDNLRKFNESPTSISSQQPASNAKRKRQEEENTHIPLPASSDPIDASNELPFGIDYPVDALLAPEIYSMQEMLNQLVTMQKEMQMKMADTISIAVTQEGKRIEDTLGGIMEKSIKENAAVLWGHFQEENAKQDKVEGDGMQQLTNMISNCLNKELPPLVEKTVKREMMALGQSIARTITPAIERTISASIAESFQRGVGDKAVNQLEKSVNSKLEATVARQIQSQFQTSGKQVLQETLRSILEASVIPAFQNSCRSMFEQVDATFQKGIVEHTSAAQKQFEALHSPLAITLRDAINSASSISQTLCNEILDGQRKLLSLAVSGENSKTMYPLVTQPGNASLGALHEKLEVPPIDPTNTLTQLIAESKYEEAFTIALQRSDVTIVSWLCSQVDLPGILSMNPALISQGVLLSLLQQLACDISDKTTQKLAWMRDILSAINPTDPMIIVHVRPIFEQVSQILNHHRSLPTTTGVELSNIRLIMHVINSMLMTST